MRFPLCLSIVLAAGTLAAQTGPDEVQKILEQPILTPDLVAFECRQYIRAKAPKLSTPASAEEWTAEAHRIRERVLRDVVFHGWPREWVTAPVKMEDAGTVPSGEGYRIRKLRYEIVPGFWGAAILYEPAVIHGKVPAVLNVNGHVGPLGKAVEYKQKRCIQQARMGIISLNLEWLSFGELSGKENDHWFAAHLDLAGASGVGLFYLAMRRGLDYLYDRPDVDHARLGVTGLSGGGWQTIFLSSLDERVTLSIPVAGYSALVSRAERKADVGDIEQNATDLLVGQDYPHLTAMRAPSPTLLIYNAEDDCCFRAALVKPYVFDAVRPFFDLYRAGDKFAWHENADPGDHNYQLDNRLNAYAFLAKQFNLEPVKEETGIAAEIKTYDELTVGLPKDNLTILGLAKQFASKIERPAGPAAERRAELRRVVRYQETGAPTAWAVANTKAKGLETRSYRFDFPNGLSATAVWLHAIKAPEKSPVTIVLDDNGKKASGAAVSNRVNRDDQVLAVDLLFTGDAAGPKGEEASDYAQMLSAIGDRPIGMEAAQLISLARWLSSMSGGRPRLEVSGIRNQLAAQIAAALEPELFSEILVRDGMKSLRHLYDTPVEYEPAADLFCLDLYKQFDVDSLADLAGPTRFDIVPAHSRPQ